MPNSNKPGHKFKQFILFQFDHEPRGGLFDVTGSFDTLDEIKAKLKKGFENPSTSYGNERYVFQVNTVVDRDSWEEVLNVSARSKIGSRIDNYELDGAHYALDLS